MTALKILDIILMVIKTCGPIIIACTILLTIMMLPVYFIRKKKKPDDPKNKIYRLVLL